MTDWREQARELAIQVLTQLDVQGDDFLPEVKPFIAESEAPKNTQELANYLVDITWTNRSKCDEYIGQTVKHWQIQRIALIDRAILRLAIAEMIYRKNVPFKVVIDQAIELAKKYSTSESPQFINGILDAIAKKLQESTNTNQSDSNADIQEEN